MKVFAISDPHLSFDTNKPMDIFGSVWIDHWQEICADWQSRVADGDVVLIAGDISWAMSLNDALRDLTAIAANNGRKIIIRGNHDYWWNSYARLTEALAPLNNIRALQNNAVRMGGFVFCGTRGWTTPEPNQTQTAEDKKIYERELIRLKLTLDEAKKLATGGEDIVALMHYPPFNSKFTPTPFTDLFTAYGVRTVVFGHLHGVRKYPAEVQIEGTVYHLTACDYLQNKLKQIF